MEYPFGEGCGERQTRLQRRPQGPLSRAAPPPSPIKPRSARASAQRSESQWRPHLHHNAAGNPSITGSTTAISSGRHPVDLPFAAIEIVVRLSPVPLASFEDFELASPVELRQIRPPIGS